MPLWTRFLLGHAASTFTVLVPVPLYIKPPAARKKLTTTNGGHGTHSTGDGFAHHQNARGPYPDQVLFPIHPIAIWFLCIPKTPWQGANVLCDACMGTCMATCMARQCHHQLWMPVLLSPCNTINCGCRTLSYHACCLQHFSSVQVQL